MNLNLRKSLYTLKWLQLLQLTKLLLNKHQVGFKNMLVEEEHKDHSKQNLMKSIMLNLKRSQ